MDETVLRLALSVALSELDNLAYRASAVALMIREQIDALDDPLPSADDAEALIARLETRWNRTCEKP